MKSNCAFSKIHKENTIKERIYLILETITF